MYKKSQSGLILQYMQKNKNKSIMPVIFVSPFIFSSIPFVWYSSSARMSELKKMWLVEKIWEKRGVKKFFFKSHNQNIYKITEKWLNLKLN